MAVETAVATGWPAGNPGLGTVSMTTGPLSATTPSDSPPCSEVPPQAISNSTIMDRKVKARFVGNIFFSFGYSTCTNERQEGGQDSATMSASSHITSCSIASTSDG